MTHSPASMLLGDIAALDSGEIARRLLMLPDSALLSSQVELRPALRREREAFDYVAARTAVLCATRASDGTVKPHLSINLIHARMALKKVAGT